MPLGVQEGSWCPVGTAQDRPRRQPRRGWETEKTSQMKQASRVQQKFNSPKISSSPTNHPPNTSSPHKKSLPTLPRANHGSTPGFFGPNPGQFGSEPGYFGSLLGRFWTSPGQNHAVLGPIFPSQKPPPPRETCKNFTSQPAHRIAPPPPRFPKFAQNSAILSQITPNSPLSVYR